MAALTPGALTVFVPEAAPDVVTLGSDLFALGAAAPNQWLVDAEGQPALRPTMLVSASPLGLINSSVTMTTLADTDVDACWIRMQPGAASAGSDVLSFAFPARKPSSHPSWTIPPASSPRRSNGAHRSVPSPG